MTLDFLGNIRLFDELDLLSRQFHLERSDQVIKVVLLAHADNGRGHVGLGELPRQGDLRNGAAALVGDVVDPVNDGVLDGAGFAERSVERVRFRADGLAVLAGQSATGERRPGD